MPEVVAKGANDKTPAVEAPPSLKRLLPSGAVVQQLLKTHLSPSGETIVSYDFGRDWIDINDEGAMPILAVWNGADHLQTLEFTRSERPPVLCEYEIGDGRHALALASFSGGDSAGVYTQIIAWRDGQYRQIFKRMGSQSRLLLAPGGIDMYESVCRMIYHQNGDWLGEGIWNAHWYQRRHWAWRGECYRRVGRVQLAAYRDPDEVVRATLALRPRHKQAAHR